MTQRSVPPVRSLPAPRTVWWQRWTWWTVVAPGGVLLFSADRLNRPTHGPLIALLVFTLVGAAVLQMLHAMWHLAREADPSPTPVGDLHLTALAEAADEEWVWRVRAAGAFAVLVCGIGVAAAGDAVTNYLAWHTLLPRAAAVEIAVFAVGAASALYGIGDVAELLEQGPPSATLPSPVRPGPATPGGRSVDAPET